MKEPSLFITWICIGFAAGVSAAACTVIVVITLRIMGVLQ